MRTTNVRTNKETEVDAGLETSKFALAVGMTMAGLVGLWGCACMVSGLINGGLGNLVKGFMTAITGN
jgi:hypothetical protein